MQIDRAGEQVVADLKAAGLAAALDPRDLNPPCVWVQIETVDMSSFDPAYWSGGWVLLAIAPDVGTLPALRILAGLLETIHGVYKTAGPATVQAVALPSGGDPLPAFRVPLSLRATDDPP